MKNRKYLPFSSLMGTLLPLVLLGIVVVGCGTSVGATPSPTSPTTPTPALAQNCGGISVMQNRAVANTPGNAGPNVAGSCFWQAFKQCRAASLTVNLGSVDTVTTHTFTLQKKDTGCTISDAVKNRIIPRPARNAGTYTCNGLVNASNELRFNGCGALGNIVVPTSQVANPQ